MSQAAAEVRRLDDVLSKLEREINDQETARMGEKIAEAEDDWRRAQADFDDLSGADDADGDTGETLDVHDAADIWLSNGMDEDYRFGYTEDELRRAAEQK